MPLTRVERLNDDLGAVPSAQAHEREQNGAPPRQQLRAVSDLTRLDLHELLGFSAIARHAPDSAPALRALPVENCIVCRPIRAPWVSRGTQDDRRAPGSRNLFDLAALPETHQLTIR